MVQFYTKLLQPKHMFGHFLEQVQNWMAFSLERPETTSLGHTRTRAWLLCSHLPNGLLWGENTPGLRSNRLNTANAAPFCCVYLSPSPCFWPVNEKCFLSMFSGLRALHTTFCFYFRLFPYSGKPCQTKKHQIGISELRNVWLFILLGGKFSSIYSLIAHIYLIQLVPNICCKTDLSLQ